MQAKTIQEHEFPGGGKLIFEHADGMYSEYGYQIYLQVFYAEKNEDGFYVTQIEYFPVTEVTKATQAYEYRLKAEHPSRTSGLGVSLAEIAMHNMRYLSKDMAEVHEITPIPPESNSFTWDRVRKGVSLTKNLVVMHRAEMEETGLPDHVVLVNKKTGRRLYVNLCNFDQSIDDRVEEVNNNTKPFGRLETLRDLRDFLNRVPSDELDCPVVIGSQGGQEFTKASRIIMTELKHPLIQDQHVLVTDQ
mgnify:CR=1 FL=1